MACRGVHFAITDEDAANLLNGQSNDIVMGVVEAIEEPWNEEWLYQTDKAWEAIHRCLTDGGLGFENGEYPWKLCILGGRQLYSGDDYIVSLKTPKEVSDFASSLCGAPRERLRERYFAISDPEYRAQMSEEDFEYTWDWFNGLPEFFGRSSAARRHVIFTVDQ